MIHSVLAIITTEMLQNFIPGRRAYNNTELWRMLTKTQILKSNTLLTITEVFWVLVNSHYDPLFYATNWSPNHWDEMFSLVTHKKLLNDKKLSLNWYTDLCLNTLHFSRCFKAETNHKNVNQSNVKYSDKKNYIFSVSKTITNK